MRAKICPWDAPESLRLMTPRVYKMLAVLLPGHDLDDSCALHLQAAYTAYQ